MFKRYRKIKEKRLLLFGLFQRLSEYVERYQRKASSYLNAKASKLNGKQLFISLCVFCLVFGGWSGYVIWQGFYSSAKTLHIQSVSIPKHGIQPKINAPIINALPGRELKEIEKFQQYLDSLQLSTGGKHVYDSIVHNRPGLLDSLRFIQQLYYEQLKR